MTASRYVMAAVTNKTGQRCRANSSARPSIRCTTLSAGRETAPSFVRPHRKLIASGINIFKAPSSRKGEDVLHNSAARLDDSRLSRLKVRREQHHQRRRRAMRRIGVDAGGDSAALSVRIVVAPILERPAKHFTIELLARSQSCSRGGWELDVINSVFFWVVGHRWDCGHAERPASATPRQ